MKMPAGLSLSLGMLQNQKDLWLWLAKYGGVLTVFLFFFLPVNSRLSSNMAELNSLKRQNEDLKRITTDLLTPEEIQRVKARVDLFETNLADESRTHSIVEQISKVAEDNHLKMIQIYPDSPVFVKNNEGQEIEVDGKKLSLVPVTFRVDTDFKSLGNFLKAMIDNSQWTYTVEALQMQASTEENGRLQCDITLSYITR